jgi:hypothetical protein
MDFSSSSSDPKTAIMNEVRQESAVLNARRLIEVYYANCTIAPLHYKSSPSRLESQRTLLRSLHPQARHVNLKRRINMHLSVHGKVHVCVEHSEQDICGQATAGSGSRTRRDHVLVESTLLHGHRKRTGTHPGSAFGIENIDPMYLNDKLNALLCRADLSTRTTLKCVML